MKLTLGYNRFTHCILRYIVRRRRRQDEKTFLRKMRLSMETRRSLPGDGGLPAFFYKAPKAI